MFNSKMFVAFLLLLLNTSWVVAQGKLVSIKGSVRDQSTKNKLDGAIVQLLKDGSQERKVVTPNSGSYEFELEYDHIYTLVYSKNGYETKRLEVDTKDVPADDKAKGWYKMNVDMTLFEEIEGLDVTILKKPIGKFKYDSSKKDFAHDPAYTASIKNKLSELMANYEQKKKEKDEQLKNAKEADKDKEMNEKKFKILMSKGDEAFNTRDYGKSMDSYQAALALKPGDVIAKNKYEKAKQKDDERLKKIEEAKKGIKTSSPDKVQTSTSSTSSQKVAVNTPPVQKKEEKKMDYEEFEKARAREREELKRKQEEEKARKEAERKERMAAREKELAVMGKEGEGDENLSFEERKAKEREAMQKRIDEQNKRKEEERIAFEKKKKEELERLNKEREEEASKEEQERLRKIKELQADQEKEEPNTGWDDDLGEKVNKSSTQVEIDMKSKLDKEQVDNYENLRKYQDELTQKKQAKEESYKAERMQQYDSITEQKSAASKYQRDNSEEIRAKAKEYEEYRQQIAELEKSRLNQSKAERDVTNEEIRKLKEKREEEEREAYEKNKDNYKSFEAYKKAISEIESERHATAKEKRSGVYEEIEKTKEKKSVANEDAAAQNKEAYEELDSYKKELSQSEHAKKEASESRRSETTKEIEESKKTLAEKQHNEENVRQNKKDLYAKQQKMKEIEREREEIQKKRAQEYLEKTEGLKEGKTGDVDTGFEGNELVAKYPEGVTEEVYEQKNEAGDILKTTIRRIVVKGKHADEYRKIVAKWGTTYFKNGRAVSETVWTTETSKVSQ